MANDEHLAILTQGVEVWNKWREENPDIIPDLSETDLYQADLSKANLTAANLHEADLMGADLIKANLSEVNLSGANLIWADLTWANLSRANLCNAELCGANLRGANLSSANLCDAWLREAEVTNAIFYNATLTGAFIKNWVVNSGTNLDGIICEYVYLGENETERRPINGNLAPGEFTSLYKKILENADLILRKTPENENTLNKPEKNIDVDNTSNNQGVRFFPNRKIHTWERLRFRSKTEIKIAEALDRTGVLFVPNSLARLNTPKGRENKEADFLICYNGKWGVLEVDGPFHTAERRVEEQERERIFKKNGIKVVERFDAERCYNNPDEVVQEFFKMIEIGYY